MNQYLFIVVNQHHSLKSKNIAEKLEIAAVQNTVNLFPLFVDTVLGPWTPVTLLSECDTCCSYLIRDLPQVVRKNDL